MVWVFLVAFWFTLGKFQKHCCGVKVKKYVKGVNFLQILNSTFTGLFSFLNWAYGRIALRQKSAISQEERRKQISVATSSIPRAPPIPALPPPENNIYMDPHQAVVHFSSHPPVRNDPRRISEVFGPWPPPALGCIAKHPAKMVKITINGTLAPALFDTGSHITLVTREMATMIGIQKFYPADTMTAQSVTGHQLSFIGYFQGDIQVKRDQFQSKIYVVEKCPYACILGRDSIQKCSEQTISMLIAETCKPEKLTNPMRSNIAPVCVAENVVIPAQCQVIILALLTVTLGSTVIFQAELTDVNKYGVLAAHAIVDGTKNFVPVRLLNCLNSEVTIYRGTKIGFCEPGEVLESTSTAGAILETEETNIYKDPRFKDLDFTSADLNLGQKQQLLDTLWEYQDVFAKNNQELGRCKILKHTIDTQGHPPIKMPLYRTALKHREVIEEHVHTMLKQGVIQPSSSPWASPVVLVQKKSGEVRFCVDFRCLNLITKRDNLITLNPLPRIDDILDSLGLASYFSTLDLQSGYWQVMMEEKDQEKTAFASFSGLYEFTVMPFGLCNAPSLFQRVMEIALTGLQ